MSRHTCDLLVIGGGVVGLTVALEAKRRFPDARVLLIEKESACGRHASGRNSGVLHAGFYYTADSLKARFSREGNQRLTEYCSDRDLPISRCGKLVVARSEADLAGLEELSRRAILNGVHLEEVSASEARHIEPRARTRERALFSPATAVVDSGAVIRSLARDAEREGIEIHLSTAYRGRYRGEVRTARASIAAGYVINAAGLYADRIARDFGFADEYRILPFRGSYLTAKLERPPRVHVYPVPDLRYPFLGVHLTRAVDGQTKIGPTAVPALWREHYGSFRNFRPDEVLEVGRLAAVLLRADAFHFRRLARRELEKRSRRRMLRLASELADDLPPALSWTWGRPGLRAQLVDTARKRLEMDFVIQGDDRSLHVLNAVSPAFTCALPFAEHVLDEVAQRVETGPAARVAPSRVDPPLGSPAAGWTEGSPRLAASWRA